MQGIDKDTLAFLLTPEVRGLFVQWSCVLALCSWRILRWRSREWRSLAHTRPIHCECMQGSKSFWQDVWEKNHKVYKATRERREAFEGLMSFPDLCSLLQHQEEKGKCLQFVKDIHAMRYVDGEREDVMTEPFSPIESGEAEELYEAGATFQVCANRLTKMLLGS